MHKGERRFVQLIAAVAVAALAAELLGLPAWTIDVVVGLGVSSVISASVFALLQANLEPLQGQSVGPIGVLWLISFVLTQLLF